MNPWPGVPSIPPYVLHDDAHAIEHFNRHASMRARIETALLPEPFVGRLDAPVVLLALNPGVSDGDFDLHQDATFQSRIRACHRQDSVDWPYYYLDPSVKGPGARWSHRVLGNLIAEVGEVRAAHGVVLLEYFPYHSRGFSHGRVGLSSQQWTFLTVRNALATASAVFVTRGFKFWVSAVPELAGHGRLFRTRSRQNIVISPRNCPEGWEAAVAGLRLAG